MRCIYVKTHRLSASVILKHRSLIVWDNLVLSHVTRRKPVQIHVAFVRSTAFISVDRMEISSCATVVWSDGSKPWLRGLDDKGLLLLIRCDSGTTQITRPHSGDTAERVLRHSALRPCRNFVTRDLKTCCRTRWADYCQLIQ